MSAGAFGRGLANDRQKRVRSPSGGGKLRGMMSKTPTTPAVPRRRKPKLNPAHPVYEIDLWLVDSDPPIWRSLAVPADLGLDRLHVLIQIVMEWKNSHLHEFETKSGRRFEPATPVGGVDAMWSMLLGPTQEAEEESHISLRDLFDDLKPYLVYMYDFGDSWLHGIKLINTHPDASAFAQLPMCLAGERAGPPDDSGGVWGYQEKLEILRNPDPKDDWHQEVIEWMGGPQFDPEAFDLDAKNHQIREVNWHESRLHPQSRKRGKTKGRKRKSR